MAKNAFCDMLDKAPLPSNTIILPFIHNTTYTAFLDIVKSGNLEPRHCNVFDMNLLYFFYGRTDYRVSENQMEKYSEALLPASFIIKADKAIPLYAIYPFDTGGYHQLLFKRYFTKKYNFEEFLLGNETVKASQFVELFYTNNEDYLLLETKNVFSVELIVNEYNNLINAKENHDFDARCSAIEIQVIHKIPIPDALEAIIIPRKFFLQELIKQMIEKGIKVITYDTPSLLQPNKYNEVLRQRVIDYYRENKYL